MAKAIGSPIDPPALTANIGQYQADVAIYISDLNDWCRENGGGGRLMGHIFRHPMADSYAEYLVYKTSPLTLIHLDTYDGWQAPDYVIRGIEASDIR